MVKSFQYNPRKTTEKTEDDVNTLITATTPLVSTYDDDANSLTLSVDTGKTGGKLLKIKADETIADGEFIKLDGDFVVGGVPLNTQLSIENVQDIVGLMVVGGTETNISVTYTDETGKLNFVADNDNTQLTDGAVQDIVNDMTGSNANNLLKVKSTVTISTGSVLLMTGNAVEGVATGISTNNIMRVGTLANDQYLFSSSANIHGKSLDDLKADAGTTNIKATGGSTGIGSILNNTPLATLHVGDSNGEGKIENEKRRRFRYSGGFQVNNTATQTSMSIYAVSSIISGDYVMSMEGTLVSSDDRIKSEETPIELATEKLLQITPKNYWKHSKYRVDEDDEAPVDKDASGNIIEKIWESGVIAQQIENVEGLQHLVMTGPDMNTEDKEIKVVNYEGLIPFLIKSIQELNERIVILENK